MKEKTYPTPSGCIHYWTNDLNKSRPSLVMLPGLTADHRLFEKQILSFEGDYNLFVWDAPGHGLSRPFTLDFTLEGKTTWLHEILQREGITRPILIGQSMGGYVAQYFLQKYPGEARGFVCIDSAPLKKAYMTGLEIWLLKRTEPMYRAFPWKMLKDIAVGGCATSEYGRSLMRSFVEDYEKGEYCRLSGHGTAMLAGAVEEDLPYILSCPTILICGEKDNSGSAKGYNRRWSKKEGLPLYWIKGAGHNSNTDRPEEVNAILKSFVDSLKEGE